MDENWFGAWLAIGVLLMSFAAAISFLSGMPVEALAPVAAIGYLVCSAIALLADRLDTRLRSTDRGEDA